MLLVALAGNVVCCSVADTSCRHTSQNALVYMGHWAAMGHPALQLHNRLCSLADCASMVTVQLASCTALQLYFSSACAADLMQPM
jgi:hypothetical protein